MTNYAQHLKPASPEQVQLLRKLALEKGVSFTAPASSAQAREQIDSLLCRERPSRQQDAEELRAIREELASGAGAVAVIHDEEIAGYGSTAHWS